MDTDIRECISCGYETDCINGVCLECSLGGPKEVEDSTCACELLECEYWKHSRCGRLNIQECQHKKLAAKIDRVFDRITELEERKEPKMFPTAIPYHPDECPGCVDVYHQKDEYNLIFKCNECGDQRKLTLDPDDMCAFPIGLTSPANKDEIKN